MQVFIAFLPFPPQHQRPIFIAWFKAYGKWTRTVGNSTVESVVAEIIEHRQSGLRIDGLADIESPENHSNCNPKTSLSEWNTNTNATTKTKTTGFIARHELATAVEETLRPKSLGMLVTAFVVLYRIARKINNTPFQNVIFLPIVLDDIVGCVLMGDASTSCEKKKTTGLPFSFARNIHSHRADSNGAPHA